MLLGIGGAFNVTCWRLQHEMIKLNGTVTNSLIMALSSTQGESGAFLWNAVFPNAGRCGPMKFRAKIVVG